MGLGREARAVHSEPGTPRGTLQNDGILMPLHKQHFSAAAHFVITFCALVFDPGAVTVAFVLSSDQESAAWRTVLRNVTVAAAGRSPCNLLWATTSLNRIQWARDKRLTPCEKSLADPEWDHNTSLRYRTERKKWRIVTLKKLYGLLFFNFSRTFVIDAEARVVKPFSIASLFSSFFSRPSLWYTQRTLMNKKYIYGAQMPSAVLLQGLLQPPRKWKNTSQLAASVGIPEGAIFFGRPTLVL